MASSPITSWQIHGETMETVTDFIFLGSKITADCDFSHEIKRHLLLGRKANSILKKTEILLCQQRSISSQSYGFSGSHVWMWELHHKDSLVVKNWCFWTAVLERTLESPLDCKEIQPVHSEDQPWGLAPVHISILGVWLTHHPGPRKLRTRCKKPSLF